VHPLASAALRLLCALLRAWVAGALLVAVLIVAVPALVFVVIEAVMRWRHGG
jgi:hypothetical protein